MGILGGDTACAKVLRWEHTRCVQGTARRYVWSRGSKVEREGGEIKEGMGLYPSGSCGQGKHFVFTWNELGTTGGL